MDEACPTIETEAVSDGTRLTITIAWPPTERQEGGGRRGSWPVPEADQQDMSGEASALKVQCLGERSTGTLFRSAEQSGERQKKRAGLNTSAVISLADVA